MNQEDIKKYAQLLDVLDKTQKEYAVFQQEINDLKNKYQKDPKNIKLLEEFERKSEQYEIFIKKLNDLNKKVLELKNKIN